MCTEMTANAAALSNGGRTENRNVMLAHGLRRFKSVGPADVHQRCSHLRLTATAFRVMPEDRPLYGEGGL